MNMWLRLVGLITVLGAILVPWTTHVSAQEPVRVSIGYLRGSSAVPIRAIQDQGIAQSLGLEVDAREFVDINALDRAFSLGELDVHSSLSLNTWGALLGQGKDFVGVLATLRPNGYIVVPSDSPYQTIPDLVGKRVGVYGISNTSTAMFGIIAWQRHGLDVRSDMQLFGSAPAVLPTLLAKGELDAILNLPPFVPRMVASGENRIILSLADEWQSLTGHQIPFTVMVASRDTIQANPEGVRRMAAAWSQAVEYVRLNPDAMTGYLADAGITDPADITFAQDMMVPDFMNTWTTGEVDNIRLYWDQAVSNGYLQDAVQSDNWYTLDFVP